MELVLELLYEGGRGGDTQDNKPKKRDEWMTMLPAERNPAAVLTNRQFSRKDNVTGRGDTSGWTDTPEDVARKRQKTKPAKEEEVVDKSVFDNAKDDISSKIMKNYNEAFRSKTLFEEHQEKLKKKQKEDDANGISEKKCIQAI